MINREHMERKQSNISSTIFTAAVILAGFVIITVFFMTKLSSDLEKVSELSVTKSNEYQLALKEIKDEKEKMSFMSYVVDIKNILDSYGARTGSYNSMDFAYLIVKESFDNDLDPLLVLAVMSTESSFRRQVVSHKGAIGLMQVLPQTAYYVSEMHDHIDLKSSEQLFEPRKNVTIGINYLSYLVDKFKNQKYALIAYNMGPTNLIRKIREGNTPPDKYYRKVMKSYQQIVNISNRT